MLQGRINVGFGILVVSMQFTVGALLVDEQGRLLLGLRSADKQSWPSHWDVIGGKVEPGESLEGALVRELQEEIGVVPSNLLLVAELREPRPDLYGDALHHVFLVKRWRGRPVNASDEHSEIRWFTIEELAKVSNLADQAYIDLARALLRPASQRQLKPTFVADAMWGADCIGYQLQFRPGPRLLQRLGDAQDLVERSLTHLRRIPAHSLHMTVLTLLPATRVDDNSELPTSRDADGPLRAVSALCSSIKAIPIELAQVRAFEKAVVLYGRESAELGAFRNALIEAIAQPQLAPPSIAHVSLFRYAEIDPRLHNLDFALAPPIELDMDDLCLVEERRYPSLEVQILRRWRLGG
jgi:8-oxo-dGTP diphosphatase